MEAASEGLEILEKMRMGVAYKHPVSIRNFHCMLRPLTIDEQNNLFQEIKHTLDMTPEAQRTGLMETTLLASKTIERASTMEPGMAPQLNSYIIAKMTPDEVICIYNQYLDILDKVNPSLEQLTTEQVEGLVEEVKKNRLALADQSSWQLRQVVGHLLTNDY